MNQNTETAKPHWGYRLVVTSAIAMTGVSMAFVVLEIPQEDGIFFGTSTVLLSLNYLLRFRKLASDAIEFDKQYGAWTGNVWSSAGQAEAQRLFLGIGLAIFGAGCLLLAKPDWGRLEPQIVNFLGMKAFLIK